jgi:hypothetical protein
MYIPKAATRLLIFADVPEFLCDKNLDYVRVVCLVRSVEWRLSLLEKAG